MACQRSQNPCNKKESPIMPRFMTATPGALGGAIGHTAAPGTTGSVLKASRPHFLSYKEEKRRMTGLGQRES